MLLLTTIALACRSPQPAPAPPAAPAAPPRAESLPSGISEALQLRDDEARFERALQHLTRSADVATARHARALRALDRAATGDAREAIRLLESAAAESPLLAPILLVEAAKAHAAAGDHLGALDAARAVFSTYPESGASAEAKILAPAFALRYGDPFVASSLLDAALRVPLDSSSEAQLAALADNLEAQHRPDLALRVRRHLVESYPHGRLLEQMFPLVLSPEGVASPFDTMTVSQLATLAERLARFGHADEGLELIALLRRRATSGSGGERVRIASARLHYRLREYESMLAISIDRKSQYFAEFQTMRARALWRLGRDAEFLRLVNETIKRPPTSGAELEARELLARFHAVERADHETAAKIFGVIVARGSSGAQGEMLWELAWQQLLAGRQDDALATLDRYVRNFPDADYTTNALFWKGKLLEARGDLAARDAAFDRLVRERPYDYFSHRARAIRSLPGVEGSSIADAGAFPDVDSSPRLADVRVERARELAALDLHEHAAREWSSLAAAYPSDAAVSFHRADALARAGEANRAIQILLRDFRDVVRHGARDVPPRFWQILYPRANWDEITATSSKRALDPWLVAAIIRQESAFEPSVISGAGAVGLMQIMPEHASRIASAETPGREVSRDELFDPATNIGLGTIELRALLDRLDGNDVLAVASYNAGETAVRRWTARRSIDADLDRFVESIPYAETRLYVKIVMKNREEYRRVYGEGAEARGDETMSRR
ncbi:MAG: transglycosylase SLT domain-containing protein [Thermoanaerobaculia bacterium]